MGLKEKRKSKGYSQEEISSLLGIPLRTYKRYEQEENKKSYKYKLLLDKLSTLNKKTKSKELKRRDFAVIGAGHVGLPIGHILSQNNKVIFIDNDTKTVEEINKKHFLNKDIIPLKVPNNLKAYSDKKYLRNVDISIICLPTDYDESIGGLNTDVIEEYIKYIDEENPGSIIVIKSTVPIGFSSRMNNTFKHVEIISCPEFLRENHGYEDTWYPDRIIFGVSKKNLKNKMVALLFESIVKNNAKTIFMSFDESESVKLFSNAFLSMRVAYFNELDSFAMKNNLSAKNIIRAVSLDNRIGDFYNNPSFGYGGYCLPKDTKQLESIMDEDSILISSISKSNELRKRQIIESIVNGTNKCIGVYCVNKLDSALSDIAFLLMKKGYSVINFSDVESIKSKIQDIDYLLVNRMSNELEEFKDKVVTRDLLYKSNM